MKRRLMIIAMAGLLLLAGALPAGASKDELPRYILDQLHNDITYTIITEKNLDGIDKLIQNHSPRHFAVIQADPGQFQEEHGKKLMEWVGEGGILWYYDSRLAPFFGMENSPLDRGEINGQPYKGDYGTGKAPGYNVIAHSVPFGDHPVVSGVESIQVFLMEVSPDKFSAVSSETPGVTPAFQVNLQKRSVVALKSVGKGWVIFKPLIWLDVLAGERLQANLKEFSGGYPVPKSGKPIIPPEALKPDKTGKVKLSRFDSLILADGQQVIGKVDEDFIEYAGDRGIIKLSVKEIDSIKLLPTGTLITMLNGTEETGTLMSLSIKFKTLSGRIVSIDKEDVVSIKFNAGK